MRGRRVGQGWRGNEGPRKGRRESKWRGWREGKKKGEGIAIKGEGGGWRRGEGEGNVKDEGTERAEKIGRGSKWVMEGGVRGKGKGTGWKSLNS